MQINATITQSADNSVTCMLINWVMGWVICMLINFYCFTSHVYYFRLEICNKTITEFSLWFSLLKCTIKRLLDEVFVICKIISLGKSYY